jgi:uncharacterized FAD-dependent dehydrogenase
MAGAQQNEFALRSVRVPIDETDRHPVELAARHLGCERSRILAARVMRRALDVRRKKPYVELTLRVTLSDERGPIPPGLVPAPPPTVLPPPPVVVRPLPEVAVVGTGPAGLFAAHRLCAAGIRPIILERGPALPARHECIRGLLTNGDLAPEGNFHFGLGGAGTYSDGKLFTRLRGPAIRHVLEVLHAYGAGNENEILVDAHPHVGTDRWPGVLERFRAALEEQGCRFLFNTRVTGVDLREGRLVGVKLAAGAIACQAAILAPGNSARDLFESLIHAGIAAQAKPFAVGVRIVHPQNLIDRIQYGAYAGHPALPPASYRLAGTFAGRGVFSFCMCPGGQVIPTPTETERLCLNGMSNAKRDSGQANAAFVVAVSPVDLGGDDALTGVRFQRTLEEAAYRAGGGGYRAPAQRLCDFLGRRAPSGLPPTSYRPGVRSADLGVLLPPWVAAPLRQGLASFCQKLPGFDGPDAVVLGFESRTSSPLRILRGNDRMSLSVAGLFPAGEGAGYAGGITSSAVDGLHAADDLIRYLNRG